MRYMSCLQRTHYTLTALVLGCTVLLGLSVWETVAFLGHSPSKTNKAQPADAKEKKFHAQIRDGLGRAVQFPNSKNSQSFRAAVESLSNFVHERAGVKLDNEVKQKLTNLEERTLKGERRRVSIEEFIDVLTETAIDRLSRLDDQEIDHAAEVLSNGKPDLTLRANGRGFLRKPDFIAQAKAMREQSRRGDEALREGLRAAVNEEVKDRVNLYSQAVPEKFGEIRDHGVTPLQAVIITYSVAADDFMQFSRDSLRGHMEREHQALKAMGDPDPKPEKAYGPNGYFYSTSLDLVFDKKTMNDLLDRIERRGAQ